MIIRIPAFDYQNVASLALGLLLCFVFIGLSPFATSSNFEVDISTTGGGNYIRQLVFLSFFILSLFLFFQKKDFSDFSKIPLFSAFMIWCLLSVIWADHPEISIRRVILLLITVSTIFMLVSCMSLEQVINCLTRTLAVLIVISLLSVLIIPGAVHQGAELFDTGLEGNWKGVFIHKNHAGPALVIATSLFIYQFFQKRSFLWLVLVFISLIFLYFTKSKTSMALFFPSLIFGFILFKTLKNKIISRVVGILFLLILSMIFFLREPILFALSTILENPEAFTGRSTIWDIIFRVVQDHFWLGIGYGSVWYVGDNMLIADYGHGWVDWVYTLTHAHNGYLEVLISLGFIGLVLCVTTFVIMPLFKAISLSNSAVHPFMYLFFSSFFFFSLHNLLETDFLYPDGRWFIILIFYFTLYLKSECLKSKKSASEHSE